MFKKNDLPMKSNFSYVKSVTKFIPGLALLLLLSWNIKANAQCEFATVSSGTSTKLEQYRPPYTFSLALNPYPRIPGDIVGMGIAGSNDHVYVWYKDGTVSSGTSWNLAEYREPYNYSLPPGKTPQDIVGMGIAGSDDHVYVWCKDGTVSSGTSSDPSYNRKPYKYSLPAGTGKTPGDIVGMGIAGSNDHVYVWYKDGTVSSGTSWNLGQYQGSAPTVKPSPGYPHKYVLPPGASPGDIVGMGIAGSDDHVYVWYRSKGAAKGDLAAVDWCYEIYEPPGPGQTITITFYPRMKNPGQSGWCSPREGSYTIGASHGSIIEQKTHKLRKSPHWSIGPGETKTLEGVTLPFSPNNIYQFRGWFFAHPDDVNSKNNEFSTNMIPVKGYRFEKGGDMVHKECPKEK